MAVLLVNQHTVPIFIDIVNTFAETGVKTILFTGHIEKGGKPISDKVKIIKSVKYNRGSLYRRLATWLIFSLHYFFYLLFVKKPASVLVVTNPPIAPLITGLIASWRGIHYSILIYDLYPEAFEQANILKENNFIYRVWQNGNLKFFKTARQIFTLSESMKIAASKYVDKSDKLIVIHNWADTSYIHPMPKTENPFIKQHRLENKIVVMYAGNMGLTHDLESVIEAAELLKETTDLVFVFMGDGGKRILLQQMVRDKELKNVHFLSYQNSANFPFAMAAADIGLVTLGMGAEGISVPSKTYINLAAGSCLLAVAPQHSELSRLIGEHKAGIICEPGNPVKIAASIKELIENASLLNSYKENALGASRHFTPENAKEYIRAVMQDVYLQR